jgi:hypothetical protein
MKRSSSVTPGNSLLWRFAKTPQITSARSREAAPRARPEPGARILWREDYQTHHWTVLADPEGNEFCLGDFG